MSLPCEHEADIAVMRKEIDTLNVTMGKLETAISGLVKVTVDLSNVIAEMKGRQQQNQWTINTLVAVSSVCITYIVSVQ